MGAKKGQYAELKMDVNGTPVVVAKLRTWSYSTEVEEIDSTAAGQEWTTSEAGHKSWEGEAEIIDVDTYYLEFLGEKAKLQFFQEKGDTVCEEGMAIITGIEKTAAYDDLIEQSLSFKGDGPLEKKTVTP